MEPKQKKILVWIIIVVLLVLGYSALVYVNAFSRSASMMNSRTYVATGEGKITAKPDVAVFTFSILDQGGKDIGAIKTENDKKSNKIVSFLGAQGVAKEDIKTLNYNVNPRYETCYSTAGRICPPASIVGYEISQTFQVKIRDFTKLNNILSGTVTAGANNVSQITFTIDDMSKLKNEAKAVAIKNAKAQAEVVAKAGGFGLGKIISIDEGGNVPSPMYDAVSVKGYGAGPMMAMERTVSSIEPGTQEITVDVTVRFEID